MSDTRDDAIITKSRSPKTLTHLLIKTFGSAVYGVEAITITVEVNVSAGQG